MAEPTLQRPAVHAEARPLEPVEKPRMQAPEASALDGDAQEPNDTARQRWRIGLFLLAPISAVASARAQLENARNQILYLKASYNQSLAEIAQAEAKLPFYQTNLQRLEKLVR